MSRKQALPVWVTAVCAVVVALAWLRGARADTPPNPQADIPWAGGTGGVADIENAFNNARRLEERQLGLAAGSLGSLDLPSQRKWNLRSDEKKALFIINAEREARGGSAPGVLGLRLSDIQPDVQALA